MDRVFHVLTESEPFSEFHGGAVSRWVANVTRFDGNSLILAPSVDESWGFDPSRMRVVKGLRRYKGLNEGGGYKLPWMFRLAVLAGILGRSLADLAPGDTVVVHNRPEFAAALEPMVHGRGAKLFLQLHNSHIVSWSGPKDVEIGADGYLFLTHFLQEEALSRFPGLGNASVLYSGADEAIFYPRPAAEDVGTVPEVLFVGRLVPEKGIHVLVEAMRLLAERDVKLQATIVGGTGFGRSEESDYVRGLRQSARANVRFEPYCSGAALGARFRAANIFCVPSCWKEPLGLVVLEAMASGLPVVASHTGGIPELLADGGGVLVEPGSSVELAAALEQLAGNAALRTRLGVAGRESFERNFTWGMARERLRDVLLQAETMHALAGTTRGEL